MKKSILIIAAAALMAACGPKKEEGFTHKTDVFLENKVGNYLAKHPDWKSTEDKDAEVTSDFRDSVIIWSNDDRFFENLPLELKKLENEKVQNQDVKIAYFETFNDPTRVKESLLNDMRLTIRGIVPPSQVAQLKEGQRYTISASMYKQGRKKDVSYTKEEKSQVFDLGSYTFAVTGVKPL
ncbi:hypothetical protein C7T94_13080 [Pedobacter yulinensis]|uniref:Lipoprotein n=1 Tax=Pedobacter yulinensis TaxID=2126353 RepID=A0A2T3HM20_9SPHI|nr:hypothetical protein [Pedobacter yulinensis]PST83487.1 hypothetical protein C7T94_13080 [Pedobacter yulinensis]